jgi:hypothetical protein
MKRALRGFVCSNISENREVLKTSFVPELAKPDLS